LAPPPRNSCRRRSAIADQRRASPTRRNWHKPNWRPRVRHRRRSLVPVRRLSARSRLPGIWGRVEPDRARAAPRRHHRRRVHPKRPRDARAHDPYIRTRPAPITMQELRAFRFSDSASGKNAIVAVMFNTSKQLKKHICAAPVKLP